MASFAVSCPKSSLLARFGSSSHNSNRNRSSTQKVAFGFWQPTRKQFTAQKKITQVGAEKSANSAVVVETKPDAALKERNGSLGTPTSTVPDASTISAFMTQVSDLIKLVDSRDISELQLKQLDCELTIRKKEALQQIPATAPMMAMPAPLPHAMLPPQAALAPAAAPALPPPSAAPSPAPASPAPAKPAGSLHPPLKCPMAGTFYRSPAPGEPPFFKVGDKVQKGQVVCIIEAMKLMNEIEADQSGTIAEILVEDGKPVSVDTPLFVIVP